MGPCRWNQAHEHLQHDVYGQVVLSAVQAFFDERLLRPSDVEDFSALEAVGERAFALHDQPDAGLWEFRTIARVHTYSSVMCWAACDRLENAALKLGLAERAAFWRERAHIIRERIEKDAWVESEGRFGASFDGTELDASLLQMLELRFLAPEDPRFRATFDAVERDLRRGPYLMRYVQPDDFGSRRPPSTSAPSGSSRRCTWSAARKRLARSMRRCWPGARARASCPRTSASRTAAFGGTTPRPTPSWG
jgi:GH15 family glucan-1,4-alpha-glucosidase